MIGDVLAPGHDVLIDDGLVRLRVEEVDGGGRARCAVVVGGRVSSHKGVNLPGVPIPIPSLTEKDTIDLEFALGIDVDFVALSFVRSAADVRDLRALIERAGSHAHVIAKIEKSEAVDVLDDVLAETDAVMVARGDLGVEIGAALVPLLQKRIILRCLEVGKPVITATQMLESMVHQAEPTRAEASDVANAILDGTSAVMLSGETAVGDYPVEAVATMDRIARVIEPSMDYRHELPEANENPTIGGAMSNAACDLAEALRREGDPRADGHREDAVRRRAPPSPPPDRRADARRLGDAPAGARVGRHAAGDPGDGRRRRPVEPLRLRGAGGGPHRARRPRRHHRGNRREHPRLDQRDQGRHRVEPAPGSGSPTDAGA